MKSIISLLFALSTLTAFAQDPATTGSGDQTYVTVPGWVKPPDGKAVGSTHGTCSCDKAGNLYVNTNTDASIMVFAPDGKFLRSFPVEFKSVHGMIIREEQGEEFMYAAHLGGKRVVKMKLDGTIVWEMGYPKEANIGAYPNGFKPTGVTVASDGSIFVTDGYGANLIHKYDKDRKYIKTFGGKGTAPDQFNTPHDLAVDTRSGTERLFICDRERGRIVFWSLDGEFIEEAVTGLRQPATVSIKGNYAAIAELGGRVTILDKNNQIVSELGDNPDKSQRAKNGVPPEQWVEGTFCAPHGIAHGPGDELYVVDWNRYGRTTKLIKKK